MPYFPSINILFIHIPKTGGSSVEKYFEKKLNIQLNPKYLFSVSELINNHSYQHLTYYEIYKNKKKLNVNFNNLKLIFSIVRNPYERIISELFFRKLINKNMDCNMIEKIIINYLNSNNIYDNHKLPQYLFLIDSSGNINTNIKILKTETLNNDMKNLGWNDFNINQNHSYRTKLNYYKFLNINTINLLNNYYSKDFELLSYNKINIELYKILNPDLEQNLYLLSDYYTHLINYGITEKRPQKIQDIYPNFSLEYYKKNYSDLQNHTDLQLIYHYINYGKNEDRVYNRLL
jgi:hypothetical protein